MATLKDIAREAGVSSALVSCYLNGSKTMRMSEETRKRIGETIQRLNYRPDRLARSLRTGKSRSIGMLGGNVSNPYMGHLADEALEEARKHDYTLIFALARTEREEIAEAVDFLLRNRVDAIYSATLSVAECALLKDRNLPVVLPAYSAPGMLSVQADVTEAFCDAFGFLRSRGHETAYSYLDKPLPWNACMAEALEATGFHLVHRMYEDSVQTCLDFVAEQRPGAILLNGQSLYPLLAMIRGMEDYKPDLVIGVDEFHCFLESPLIVGGIRTSTAEKAHRGIQELIRRIEPDEFRRLWPLLGSYGFWGYFGYYFSFREWTLYKVYAAERNNLVLIEDIYEDTYIVSCDDPDGLIAFVSEARDRKRAEILRHTAGQIAK